MHKIGKPNPKHKYRYTVYGVVGGYNPKKDIAITGATFEELKAKMNTPIVSAWLEEYEQVMPEDFKC